MTMNEMIKLTKNQELVLGALSDADGALSAYQILDLLRDDGFRAPLQVYRALEKLTESGLVHRLESINAFIACAHRHKDCCGGHGAGIAAFAICEKCGHVSEFHDHGLEDRLAALTQSKKFVPSKTTVEIRGLCEACAAGA
ncbi:Fur family transcriptional regulator [Rhizobium sp. NRK18]|uniref:Fur family transcriptional regulator n=1 Tax=Rhizobium sp. NRK18 TaxID=2964667 RepID=UPI0021C48FFA|nr:Fur family transcriptional regulator [Rhizobium sp. NRK18]MCQ2003935.1 transcriptional repressor [Rhizobium sp. NRK18]